MEQRTFKRCLEIAESFKPRYNVTVTAHVFKEVMVDTLYKMTRIRPQIEEYTTVNEYIPLLFEDMLYEHYMFSSQMAKCIKMMEDRRNERAVV